MALSPSIIYDPRGHTFESWASLMCEQYAAQQLEIPNAFTNWKTWGDGLRAIDVFSNEAIPSTSNFDDWQEWAQELVNSYNPSVSST